MPTLIAFCMTLAQLVIVAVGLIKPETQLFDYAITYGSPPAMFLSVLNDNAAMLTGSFLFAMIILFHLVKYIMLAISQFQNMAIALHISAVALEVVYLATAFYYILFR